MTHEEQQAKEREPAGSEWHEGEWTYRNNRAARETDTETEHARNSPRRVRWGLFWLIRTVARAGVEPATFRFSGGRSYQLSYLAGNAGKEPNDLATLTGLEPATFAVTGRRANQLRHRALHLLRSYSLQYCVLPTGFEPALPP